MPSGGRSHTALGDRGCCHPVADRTRADGRRVGAGVPAPGTPVRRGSCLLRDGLCRRPGPRERADARLPADRARRTPARGADLRLGSRRMAEAARMVVDAGADIVDINFGCPVRKVTKTGAGASALSDHDLACGIAGTVADAVDVPVTAKMRRGSRTGRATRSSSGRGSRRSGWRRSCSTRARRSRCTPGRRPHPHGRARGAGERSRDRVGRRRRPPKRRARARLDGRRGRDGGARRPGPAVDAPGDGRARRRAPEPGEVVAELIRFMREVEREMGDRAASFLRKFYGWYLRGMPDAKSVKPELTSAPTVAEAEAALLRFCRRPATAWQATRPSSRSSPTRSPTGCSTSRSRSTAADRRGGSGPRPPDSVASAAQRAGTSAPNDA